MSIGAVPGWEGTLGPFPHQYRDPHVYARDVHSGAGNCVCGAALHDRLHVQAAPGVPMPAPPAPPPPAVCGAVYSEPGMKGFYRCTRPPRHDGDHQCVIGGQVRAAWPPVPPAVTPGR